MDLALGLLEPTSGEVTIDAEVPSRNRARAWRALTGYVPQQISIVDDTLEANICFGVRAQGKTARDSSVRRVSPRFMIS